MDIRVGTSPHIGRETDDISYDKVSLLRRACVFFSVFVFISGPIEAMDPCLLGVFYLLVEILLC